MWQRTSIVALVLAIGLATSSAAVTESSPSTTAPKSSLRRLVTLSRHGSRAPNGVVEHICPKAARLDAYHVPLEQLTEVGMRQMLAAGEYIRKVYVDELQFLAPSFNGVDRAHFETYFRADAATRCAQSATVLGFGLYPDGTGPAGFPRQAVPVTMQLKPNEHDFAAPKGPCRMVLNADLSAYGASRGRDLLKENIDALEAMGDVCGVPFANISSIPGGEDAILGVKDIADMFIFDRDEGLARVAGLSANVSAALEQLAFTHLMERYYSTDREITYWVGGFADLLLANLHGAANPSSPSSQQYRYYSYHGHRELLHGLGKMIGWNFDFKGLPKALNMTALHPATTMAFELHGHVDAETNAETYTVETFIWSPYTEREQVTLAKCSKRACPLTEFTEIIQAHIANTGTWQQICDYAPPAPATAQQKSDKQGDKAATTADTPIALGSASGDNDDGVWTKVSSGLLIGLGIAFAACLVFAVYKAVQHMRALRRDGYVPI